MKTVSNIGLIFFIGLITICSLPQSINAQQLPLLSAESDDNSDSRTILLGLTAGNSKRPSIQFSENANSIRPIDGMSIEYDGRNNAINRLNINSTTNTPIFTIDNDGNIEGDGDLRIQNGDTYLAIDPNGNTPTANSVYLPGHIYIAPFNSSTNISFLQARREDNSGDTQLNIRTYDNGSLTESMQIKKDGDVDVRGYTKLGSNDAPAIKIKKLTGKTKASEGDSTAIPHGLDATKIISVNASVFTDIGVYIGANANIPSSGAEFTLSWTDTHVNVINSNTNSEEILDKDFVVTILYEK